ncbi:MULTISPECIES: MoaD/ThiS family protein [Erythrobacteraceae]|uniref:MoaD/ThiS family protein n=1 Tax=Pontixanthobacter aquaemixtae TaxID=1958940 RepID=A0A844ZRQ6_9SPHN|nr:MULTISPECIES: MoaD/ThiS family protein [Erythrobacteraceae]MXO91011.1 MoaD/ThiS family protein [Pontixanthobacter aquaemixtae]
MNQSLNVELCGKLADSYGGSVTLDISPSGLPVRELFEAVSSAYPLLAPILAGGRIRACVNETIVPDDAIIRQGDTAALFPPVSGG